MVANVWSSPEANSRNDPQAFYARAGFVVVTRWRGYYAGGEAAFVLRRG